MTVAIVAQTAIQNRRYTPCGLPDSRAASQRRIARATAREKPSRCIHRTGGEVGRRPAFGLPQMAAPLANRALPPTAPSYLGAQIREREMTMNKKTLKLMLAGA